MVRGSVRKSVCELHQRLEMVSSVGAVPFRLKMYHSGRAYITREILLREVSVWRAGGGQTPHAPIRENSRHPELGGRGPHARDGANVGLGRSR